MPLSFFCESEGLKMASQPLLERGFARGNSDDFPFFHQPLCRGIGELILFLPITYGISKMSN